MLQYQIFKNSDFPNHMFLSKSMSGGSAGFSCFTCRWGQILSNFLIVAQHSFMFLVFIIVLLNSSFSFFNKKQIFMLWLKKIGREYSSLFLFLSFCLCDVFGFLIHLCLLLLVDPYLFSNIRFVLWWQPFTFGQCVWKISLVLVYHIFWTVRHT